MDSLLNETKADFSQAETIPAVSGEMTDFQLAFVGGGIADIIGV